MCVSFFVRHLLNHLTPRAQPGQTLRSLTEAKTLLEQTRNELTEARERAQIKPTHTFSPLPPSIFVSRPTEAMAIENALMGQPSWTVVFGAGSTGKVCRKYITLPNKSLSAPSMGDSRPRFYGTCSQIPAIMYFISTFGSLASPIWQVYT